MVSEKAEAEKQYAHDEHEYGNIRNVPLREFVNKHATTDQKEDQGGGHKDFEGVEGADDSKDEHEGSESCRYADTTAAALAAFDYDGDELDVQVIAQKGQGDRGRKGELV